MKNFLLSFAALVGVTYLAALLFPMGEVVSLHTRDAEGREHDSSLWIVDVPGGPYLRAGSPEVGWLDRLILHPRVGLERAGHDTEFDATPIEDPGVRNAVNAAMAEKYGIAERLVRRFRDVERSVVVRLEPAAGNSNHGG